MPLGAGDRKNIEKKKRIPYTDHSLFKNRVLAPPLHFNVDLFCAIVRAGGDRLPPHTNIEIGGWVGVLILFFNPLNSKT